ncbi:MAG TPA: FAD-dependent oxidoreductase, partial [Candidatus Brocadiia bacterium]|nr:FAD-dependent oxidoreductase [Candidatus Brocadiia bacterium]
MANVYEAARAIPVLEEADVVVAGGGVAGCAAAWAAAKAGAKTFLLERNGCLGGVATASLMANIGNRFLTATGEQVVHGFPAEVVDRLIGAGAASPHWKTREMPGVVIDSERLKVILIEMMREAGVTTLTHALGARPIMEGQAVKGVFVESKSGRQAIPAKAVVDCTGEADLAWQAGAEVRMETSTASILFKLANVDL